MRDDREKRRQRDLRDFEFYKRRLKPNVSELWRIIENPPENRAILEWDRQSRERSSWRFLTRKPAAQTKNNTNQPPPALARYVEKSKRHANEMIDAEVVWPLAAVAIVLFLLSLTGNIDRVLQAIAF